MTFNINAPKLRAWGKITHEFRATCVQDYQKGLSIKEIHNLRGSGIKTIYRIVKEEGVYESKKGILSNRSYFFNQSYFENIDTSLKAYFLGFLYADGCNTGEHLTVSINKKDIYLLEKLKQELETEVNIKSCAKDIVSLYVCSKKLCNDLSKHGCVPKKTFILTFPDLPEHLVHHFIRGYFDGDGCICITNKRHDFSIVGREEFVQSIQTILMEKCNLKKTKIIKNLRSPVFNVRYSGRLQTNRIADYMYKDSSFHLMRKYDKFYKL